MKNPVCEQIQARMVKARLRLLGDGIDVELAGRIRGAKGLVPNVQNGLPACIQRFVALTLLVQADDDVVLSDQVECAALERQLQSDLPLFRSAQSALLRLEETL